jgi:hypothetical protein
VDTRKVRGHRRRVHRRRRAAGARASGAATACLIALLATAIDDVTVET